MPLNKPAGLLASSNKLLPAAKRRPGQLKRGADGGIVLTRRPGKELRLCPPDRQDATCQFYSLRDAIAAANPADTVILSPGIYAQGAVVNVNRLTLRGEPGAHLKGHPVKGKAALVITGKQVVIDGIECSRIRVRDRNGACIRVEGDDLTVRNVYFHDNEQGILTGPGGGTLLVEKSRFERNGRDGQAHGLYINRKVDTFIFRHNKVLSTVNEGHGVKSRAKKTIIEYNVIASLDAQDSRAIDIPNGGEVVIRHNVLEKGPESANSQMIGIALEGKPHAKNSTIIERNLIIFDSKLPWIGRLLDDLFAIAARRGRVVFSRSPSAIRLHNNVIVGANEIGIASSAGTNKLYRTRRQAELPEYPILPNPKSAMALIESATGG